MKKGLLLIVLIFLSACTPWVTTTNEVQEAELFDYEGSFVGSPMATKNILSLIPDYGLEWKEMRLETKQQPYGIHLYYEKAREATAEEAAQEYSLYLLRLITNADYVTLHAGDKSYKYTRKQWENWLGLPLERYETEKQLKQAVQMKDEEDPDRQGLAQSS